MSNFFNKVMFNPQYVNQNYYYYSMQHIQYNQQQEIISEEYITALYQHGGGKYDKSRIFSVWIYEFAPVLHLLPKKFLAPIWQVLLEKCV